MLNTLNTLADVLILGYTCIVTCVVYRVHGDGAWLRFSFLLLFVVCAMNLPAFNVYADVVALPFAGFVLVKAATVKDGDADMLADAAAAADALAGFVLAAAARDDDGDAGVVAAADADDGALADEDEDDGSDEDGGAPTLAGTWKLVRSENYPAYLEAIKVGKLLRGVIARAPTSQVISLRGDRVRIVTRGILKMDTTYVVGGPPIEVFVKGSAFLDSVERDGADLLLTKQRVDRTYAIHVRRALTDADTLTMTSAVRFALPAKDDVVLVQTYQRQ